MITSEHVYEIRPRKDQRGLWLLTDTSFADCGSLIKTLRKVIV
jgi:hypothetical protein